MKYEHIIFISIVQALLVVVLRIHNVKTIDKMFTLFNATVEALDKKIITLRVILESRISDEEIALIEKTFKEIDESEKEKYKKIIGKD